MSGADCREGVDLADFVRGTVFVAGLLFVLGVTPMLVYGVYGYRKGGGEFMYARPMPVLLIFMFHNGIGLLLGILCLFGQWLWRWILGKLTRSRPGVPKKPCTLLVLRKRPPQLFAAAWLLSFIGFWVAGELQGTDPLDNVIVGSLCLYCGALVLFVCVKLLRERLKVPLGK